MKGVGPGGLLLPSFAGYRRERLPRDVIAGISVAAILVPQGMAYAEVAGLPPVSGLYATIFGLVGYALLGSSRQLVLGPESSTAALVAAAVAPLAGGDPAQYAVLAAGLAVIAGVLCLIAATVGLGFLGEFLSRPVLTGYLAGLAIVIVVGQLPKVLGISVDADGLLAQIGEIARHLGDANWRDMVIGGGVLAIILGARRLDERIPGVLIAVVLATAASAVLGLSEHGVAVVGTVPSGLPSIAVPGISVSEAGQLLAGAAAVAVMAFADTAITSRGFAVKGGYEVDANRDLAGLGAANVCAGLGAGFPISSSASRTAVAAASGGTSQLAGLSAAAMVAVVLLVATGLLTDVPSAALGGVVISASLRLFDVGELRAIWRGRRSEFALAMVTLLGVALWGILEGVLVAVILSVVNVIRRAARPPSAVLGVREGGEGYVNVARDPAASTIPGLVIFRFEGSLFFANAEHFRERAAAAVAQADPPAQWLVLDFEAVPDIDTTAAQTVAELCAHLQDREGIEVVVAEILGVVDEQLTHYGLHEIIGVDDFFPSLDAAVRAYELRGLRAAAGQAGDGTPR